MRPLFLALGLLLATTPPAFANWNATCGAHRDGRLMFLAVSWDSRAITLAVIGLDGWRTRVLPLQSGYRVRDVEISKSGTLMKVFSVDGDEDVIDISRLVVEVPGVRKPGHDLPANEFQRGTETSDPALAAIMAGAKWLAFQIEPRPDLYAPVLQLAGSEPIRPGPFDIWKDLPSFENAPRNARQQLLFQEYRRLGLGKQPIVYSRVCSYAGSWLYQYWLYFPFDFGFGGHLHDSEHFFVEVDKLGGTVRQLIGAGHGSLAANGIYQTFEEGALALELPLFAFVELGKHATAPDVDGNGFFTPGLDINGHLHSAKTWGVRDTLGTTDSQLRLYDTSMTIPRRPEDRLSVRGFKKIFAGSTGVGDTAEKATPGAIQRPAVGPSEIAGTVYDLRPLPAHLENQSCDEPRIECAEASVASHEDFQHAQSILKAGLFPTVFLRTSIAIEPDVNEPGADKHVSQQPAFRLGAGVEVHELLAALGRIIPPAKRIPPLPGRLVGEIGLSRRYIEDPAGVITSPQELALTSWTIRYELLLSNLYGVYYGWQSFTRDDPRYADDPGYGSRLGVGLLVQLPVPGTERWSLHIQNGLAVDVLFGLSNEFRAGLAVRLGRKKRFGLNRSTFSPYDIRAPRD